MLADKKVIGLSEEATPLHGNNRDMLACFVKVVQQLSTHNLFVSLEAITRR